MKTKRFKALTLGVLACFAAGCVSTRYISPQEIPQAAAGDKIVVTLADKSEVTMSRPLISGQKIVGRTRTSPKTEIDISRVRSVRLERTDYLYPVLFTGVLGVTAILAVGAATAPSPPPASCCPFIYAHDGKQWVLEAEPFGGAFCRALERVEWCRLDQLREDAGRYRILIANELEETQYTDELKLVVVDHPRGLTVGLDPAGRPHTFADPRPPLRAFDAEGRDILPLVRACDQAGWESLAYDGGLAVCGDTRDEITLEFPKPRNARTAKLLANVSTSLRGAMAAKGFLELYGQDLPNFYAEVNKMGPVYQRLRSWFVKEELFLLKAFVETREGWKAKGLLYGAGPFIAKEKAYIVDVSDVPGDILRIRLRPPKGFWRINSFAVDYTEDAPFETRELAARTRPAVKTGADATPHGDAAADLARADDHRYLVLGKKGDHVELEFDAPPLAPGADRTIFVKARGYYDIHLDARGEPRRELIARVYDEPGFCVRFAAERCRRELASAASGPGK